LLILNLNGRAHVSSGHAISYLFGLFAGLAISKTIIEHGWTSFRALERMGFNNTL
jgi:hypothetical protein